MEEMTAETARILGIDLTDGGAAAALSDTEETFRFPTAICRDRKNDVWYIGEDAYEKAFAGKGILTDHLLSLARKHGTATIRGVRHEGEELLCLFLQMVRRRCEELTGGKPSECVVIVLPEYRKSEADTLRNRLTDFGFDRARTFVVSRAESFLYYVMSQPREVRTGEVGLFDLSELSLEFYELQVTRERRKMYVRADRESLSEAFTLSILSGESGKKLADQIMSGCAERLMAKKIFSSVFLTGKGFDDFSWADSFRRMICTRRKVFIDQDLFTKGALVRGARMLSGGGDPGFVCMCSGRAEANVTVNVEKNGQPMVFPLISAGDPIDTAGVRLRLLPDSADQVEINIEPVGRRKGKTVRLPLSFLPERPPKAGFVDLTAEFPDEKSMKVRLKDAGFGELFAATDAAMDKEVQFWD